MSQYNGCYPSTRLRRTRAYPWVRRLVAESRLDVSDLILPLFVCEDDEVVRDIEAMPGVRRYPISELVAVVKEAEMLGIPAVMLFPVVPTSKKSEMAEEALRDDNLIGRAISKIKQDTNGIGVISDVALDPYTAHGHDGIMREGCILNDETVEVLAQQAVALAKAGSDIVAPSDMMDGRVSAIRQALDAAGYQSVMILSYAAKYASSFYGPFREAVGSKGALKTADKATYQMSPANSDEAMREVALDINEGADMVMVKPGMPYLDIVRSVKSSFAVPTFAYQVSGEYAMIKAASGNGWLDERSVMLEALLAFKRAGADAICTYAALDVARYLSEKEVK